MKFHLLAGMPGSGKSTTSQKIKADSPNCIIISSDAIRTVLNNGHYPKGEAFSQLESTTWKMVKIAVEDLLKSSFEVVLDATNLSYSERKVWVDLVNSINPNIEIICHWHTADYDSPKRWLDERNIGKEEYESIKKKLKARIQKPNPNEGFILQEI